MSARTKAKPPFPPPPEVEVWTVETDDETALLLVATLLVATLLVDVVTELAWEVEVVEVLEEVEIDTPAAKSTLWNSEYTGSLWSYRESIDAESLGGLTVRLYEAKSSV